MLIDRSLQKHCYYPNTLWPKKLRKKVVIIIFPEELGSNSSSLNPFKMGGLKALINSMPNVLIVPFVVHNNYQIFEEGTFLLN